MNNSIPDWNFISRLPGTNQVKSRGADNELVELLWQDGQVVAHSQATRKQASEQDQTSLKGTSPNETTFQDDETVSWFQYPPEDSFLKEFCPDFFSELTLLEPIKQSDEKVFKFGISNTGHVLSSAQKQAQVRHGVDPSSSADQMPPPKFHHPDSVQNDHKGGLGRIVNFSHFSSPVKGGLLSSNVIHRTKEAGNLTQGDARQCSGMTIGLSHCGSNQVLNDPDIGQVSKSAANNNSLSAEPIKDSKGKIMVIPHESCEMETFSATVSSSCGGSDGSSFGKASKQSIRVESLKRKGRDAEESDCQSEAEASKKSKSSHRSRAAEIHNLSEKRRRDRINKKMKALQELIPHCSKTDKASLLDEAIEYLKSLQLQLQIMWMGTGMAPMLIPGVQQYMSRMSMGIGPTPLGPISNPMHLPKVPLVDRSRSITPVLNQAVFCQPTALNHVSLPNQMQNLPFPEQYARYLGFQHAQNPSQPMNVFKLGPPPSSQSQTIAPSTSIPGLPSGGLN